MTDFRGAPGEAGRHLDFRLFSSVLDCQPGDILVFDASSVQSEPEGE